MAQTGPADVIKMGEEWFSKLPALPKGAKDFLVKIMPWVSLIGGIALVVLSVLALIGSPFVAMAGVGLAANLLLAAVVALAQGVIYLLSFNPLRKGQVKGWNLLFWGEVLYVVTSLLHLDVTSVLFSLIGFYLLYQIKPSYK